MEEIADCALGAVQGGNLLLSKIYGPERNPGFILHMDFEGGLIVPSQKAIQRLSMNGRSLAKVFKPPPVRMLLGPIFTTSTVPQRALSDNSQW